MVEDFYDEFLSGDRSKEIFMEFDYLRELYSRIKEKLNQDKIVQDDVIYAILFINRMEEVMPFITPDEKKFNFLKVFW